MITTLLVVVNVVVFFVLSVLGDTENTGFMLGHGAMCGPYVLEYGEYYRLITSMFLHFGFYHLVNNMVMLGALGANLEPEMGSVKFLLVYLLSGIGGNVISLIMHTGTGQVVVSAGASGAVFGLMGMLVWMAIRNKGHIGRIYGRRIYLMVGLSLYFGFASAQADNYAHLGGLLSGFVLSVLLYRKRPQIKTEERQ